MALFKKKNKNEEAPAPEVDAAVGNDAASSTAAAPPKPKIVYKVDHYTYLLGATLFFLIIALIMLMIDMNRYKKEGVLPISKLPTTPAVIASIDWPPV